MIKIIEDNSPKYREICNKCKSVLEVPIKDCIESLEEYYGEYYTVKSYVCPCCGNTNTILNK